MSVKPSILNEDLIGSRSRHDYAGNINAGYIALQRLWIAHRAALILCKLDPDSPQKRIVRMIPNQREHEVVLQLHFALRSVQDHRIWQHLANRAIEVRLDFLRFNTVLD